MKKHERSDTSNEQEVREAPAAPRRRRGGCLLRAFRYLVILAVVGIVIYVVVDQVLWWRVAAQRKEFAARYGGIAFEDFIPARPEPQDDAGRLYKQALVAIAKAGSMYEGESPHMLLTETPDAPGARNTARAMLAEAKPGLDLIMQARHMDECRLLDSYDSGDLLPAMSEVRTLARWTAAQARLEALDGDIDPAFEWITAGLHLANGMVEEPTLLVQMVREACARATISAAEDILSEGDGPSDVPAGIAEELSKLRDEALVIRGIAGESAYAFDQLYAQTIRPLAAANELKFRALIMELSNALEAGDPIARQETLQSLSARAEGLPPVPYFYIRAIFPVILTRVETFHKLSARCDMLEIALRLKSYRKEHGSYPDNLRDVYGDEDLPCDPFSGEPYHYTKDPEGFVLFCAGPGGSDEEAVIWQCTR